MSDLKLKAYTTGESLSKPTTPAPSGDIVLPEYTTGPSLKAGSPKASRNPTFMDEVKGVGEVALSMGSGVIAEPVSGLGGIATAPFQGTDQAAKNVGSIADTLTYAPKTPEGQRNMEAIANNRAIKWLGETMQGMEKASGDLGYDIQGPFLGALMTALPTAVLSVLGLKGVRKMPGGSKPAANNLQGDAAVTSIRDNMKNNNAQGVANQVNPDLNIVGAANELDIDLPASSYSQNIDYINAEQALKSQPDSNINRVETNAIEKLQRHANDLIESSGGEIDKGILDAKLREFYATEIEGLGAEAGPLFDQVRDTIPPDTQIPANNVRAHIAMQTQNLGNDKLLNASEKQLKGLVGPDADSPATYAGIDRVRGEVGRGYEGMGPFGKDNVPDLEKTYGMLAKDQMKVAENFGVSEALESANKITTAQKELQKQFQSVYGRQLTGSAITQIKSAANQLITGNAAPFRKLMAAVPGDMRQAVAATMLNDIFSAGSRGGKFGGGFRTAYAGLLKNKSAKDELFKYLPTDAGNRFDNMGKVATGLYNAIDKANHSKSARDIMFAMDDGSAFKKLTSGGSQMAAAEGLTQSVGFPGVGAALVGAKAYMGGVKTNRLAEADKMVVSPRFSQAIKVAMKANTKKGDAFITNAPVYKKWFATTTKAEQAEITKLGFVTWLTAATSNGSPTDRTAKNK